MTDNKERDEFVRDHADRLDRLLVLFEQHWDALSPDEIILAAEVVRLRARIAELEAR